MNNIRVYGKITQQDNVKISKIEIRKCTGNITKHETKYVKLTKHHGTLYMIFNCKIHNAHDITSHIDVSNVKELIKSILIQHDPDFVVNLMLQDINIKKSIFDNIHPMYQLIFQCILSMLFMVLLISFIIYISPVRKTG